MSLWKFALRCQIDNCNIYSDVVFDMLLCVNFTEIYINIDGNCWTQLSRFDLVVAIIPAI